MAENHLLGPGVGPAHGSGGGREQTVHILDNKEVRADTSASVDVMCGSSCILIDWSSHSACAFFHLLSLAQEMELLLCEVEALSQHSRTHTHTPTHPHQHMYIHAYIYGLLWQPDCSYHI